jgi:uncharacterized protein
MCQKVTVSDVQCPDWPVTGLGAVIVSGTPEATGKITFQTNDKLISSGVWTCSAGVFDLSFGWDEMSYILEGEVSIESSGGSPLKIKAGDFFFIPKGSKTRWVVTKPIKKVFFLRSPEPLG